MRTAALLLALLPFPLQSDPVERARKDLGPAFSVERVEPGVLFARPSDGSHDAVRDALRKAAKEFRSRVLDAPPQDELLVVLFGGADSYRAYTSKRYGGPVPQTTYYDVPNRRVLLRTEAVAAFGVQSVRTFLLTDSLNGNAMPPWIASALSILDDPDPSATFDHRSALLQEALKRGSFPALRAYLSLDLGSFHRRDVAELHASVALKLAAWLEQRGALKPFFNDYRGSFRKDVGGAAALETVLAAPLDAIEKDFVAHVRKLPWLHRDRFLEQAKKVFGPDPLLQVDEDLRIAVTGNVEARVATQALDGVRRLRDPLIAMLGLRTSGLPVLARLFRDQASFLEYARADAPHRQWLGGYFNYESRWLVLHLEPDAGSLTHEYCHALLEDDVGILPPWLSEGLASLYERYRIEGGLPVGERGSTLRDAKAGLPQNRVDPLATFTGFRGADFYDPDRVRLNYDVARALCLYLQEKGVL
ncbi:MAG: hypothetical protein JO332_01560, partial [Planctomycetaceae bacterium]|nr:hypothetical protein [Planctomycetaceae bacterium]